MPDRKAGKVLVEAWQRGGEISIHPSRNCFRWVSDPLEKKRLHKLAIDGMVTFSAGNREHRQWRLEHGKQVPDPKDTPKELRTPAWAREDAVIGYTSREAIQWSGDVPLLTSDSKSFPSVYYRNGHATVDHTTPGNLGWEYGTEWICLFFGNVPKADLVY